MSLEVAAELIEPPSGAVVPVDDDVVGAVVGAVVVVVAGVVVIGAVDAAVVTVPFVAFVATGAGAEPVCNAFNRDIFPSAVPTFDIPYLEASACLLDIEGS